MNEFVLELEKLRDVPVTLRYDCAPAALELEDPEAPDVTFPGAVTGEVTFARAGRDVVAHGRLGVMARSACARCLEPAETALDAAIDELWIEKARPQRRTAREDEDLEPDLARLIVDGRVEMAEAYREALLAELPARLVCREDCKGLCPGCGANLNQETCRCAIQPERAGNDPSADASAPGASGAPGALEWKSKLKNLQLDQ